MLLAPHKSINSTGDFLHHYENVEIASFLTNFQHQKTSQSEQILIYKRKKIRVRTGCKLMMGFWNRSLTRFIWCWVELNELKIGFEESERKMWGELFFEEIENTQKKSQCLYLRWWLLLLFYIHPNHHHLLLSLFYLAFGFEH